MLKGVMQSGGKGVWADIEGLTDAHPLGKDVELSTLILRDVYGHLCIVHE